ncbi:MAG: hypothetical protein OSJ28_10020 [Desulfovibrio sp.]|nr:hypothetical protein [Desulfovibrio sp.]
MKTSAQDFCRGFEMDKNRSEVYGTFTYAESLTYYDLLETENTLKENLDKLFLGAGAEHLDFTPLGDMLMFQCAFEEYDSDLYRKLADKCAGFLPAKVSGRFLCLEKNLDTCDIFWIRHGEWQVMNFELPRKAPENTPVHMVKSVDK